MSAVVTTSDYRTWNVDDRSHTKQELKDYVNSLNFSAADHIRTMAVVPADKVVVVNGLPVIFRELAGGSLTFDTAIGAYTENNNYAIHGLHYYADRDHVEVEYSHHPCDPKPPNTRHTSSEFGTMLSDCFLIWKTAIIERLTEQIAEQAAQQFNLTDNSMNPTGNN